MQRITAIILCAITICSFAGCAQKTQRTSPGVVRTPEARGHTVRQWAYWLQNPDLAALASYPADLVVIDYSYDGSDAKAFDRKSIKMLQNAGKTVLCYFSIGEAETYRFYWNATWDQKPPAFLGAENPDWPGNFKVRYWSPEWMQAALIPYMDRILAAGFDGVYLDIIDAYWYWHEKEGIDIRKTADDMVTLVADIARYMRGRAGREFIICPQNAEGIISDASSKYRQLYFNTIDMIGVESLFFNIYSPEDQKYRMNLLREYATHNLPVLNIEYISSDKYEQYLHMARTVGFPVTPYAAAPDAALNLLTPAGWASREE